MQQAEQITQRRLAIWDQYHAWAHQHEQAGRLRRPVIPPHCTHNAHMYYMLLPSLEARTHFIATLREQGVQAVFHYIPLHSSPAGQAIGRTGSSMAVTDDISDRLVRMPLWLGVEDHLPAIFAAADQALAGR